MTHRCISQLFPLPLLLPPLSIKPPTAQATQQKCFPILIAAWNRFCSMMALLLLISGCNTAEKSYDSMSKSLEDLKKGLSEVADDPSKSLDEFYKLRQIEYKVVDLSLDIPSGELESRLNELGKESWDCHALPLKPQVLALTQSDMRLLCKRNTRTPLRYLVR